MDAFEDLYATVKIKIVLKCNFQTDSCGEVVYKNKSEFGIGHEKYESINKILSMFQRFSESLWTIEYDIKKIIENL